MSSEQWLYDGQNGIQPLFDVFVLGLDNLLLANHMLKVLIRLLRSQLLDPSFQSLNLAFGTLTNGSLGLSIVRTLLGQLIRGQIGYPSRACSGRSPLLERGG